VVNVINLIAVSIPEALISLFFGLSIINQKIKPVFNKMLIYACVFGMASFVLTELKVPYEFKILLLFVAMNGLVYHLILKNIKDTIIVCVCMYCITNASEFVIINVFKLFSISLEQILHNKLFLLGAVWSYLIIVLIGASTINFFDFDVRRLIPKAKTNRYLTLLFLTGAVEFFFILHCFTRYYLKETNAANVFFIDNIPMLLWLILVCFLLMIWLFNQYLKATVSEVEVRTEKPHIQTTRELLNSIQQFRHDFVNHFAVVGGFVEQGMNDKAKLYIDEILNEVKGISQPIEGERDPAVSLLLQSKLAVCQANNIMFSFTAISNASLKRVSSKDKVAIIGNLMDNAIRATQSIRDNKYIKVIKSEDESEYVLTIENSGETIPPDKLTDIFNLGYTTKEDGTGGQGLYIVKKIVQKYHGIIEVSSLNNVTCFSIRIPKT